MLKTTWERRTSQQTESIWLKIVQRHHEAHALARCGATTQARALLEDTLPHLIKEWSQNSGLPRNLQILRLRKLLRGDLSTVLKPRTSHTPKAGPTPNNAKPNPTRIPLNQISEMIDAVHISEAEQHFHAVAS